MTHMTLLQEVFRITLELGDNVVFILGRVVGIESEPDPTEVELSHESFADLSPFSI